MGGQKQKMNLVWATNYSVPTRNLTETNLGAVIFGATHHTIKECLSRQLFGLPKGHYSYVKNIKQGLVIFLFNYSDRTLHGVFEAASPGQLNLDRYAWVTDGDGTRRYTKYPAQVKVRVRALCHPMMEKQFGTIIAGNYYEGGHFHFELDHHQTSKLMSVFMASPMTSGISKWNKLYASLPTHTKKLEYDTHSVTGVIIVQEPEAGVHSLDENLKESSKTGVTNAHKPEAVGRSLDENLNDTSKISSASPLGRTAGTITTTDSSSQLPKKWTALFNSESG